jgi:hypothetical protein
VPEDARIDAESDRPHVADFRVAVFTLPHPELLLLVFRRDSVAVQDVLGMRDWRCRLR